MDAVFVSHTGRVSGRVRLSYDKFWNNANFERQVGGGHSGHRAIGGRASRFNSDSWIIATGFICAVLIRRLKWHAWYVERFNALPGAQGKVFPKEPDKINKMKLGYTAKRVIYLGYALFIGWVTILAVHTWHR
jgi:hypothetical protein